MKPFQGKKNWQVWATKFWHFLNHDGFPIEDGRVDRFFHLSRSNSIAKYEELLARFRKFVSSRETWLPALREADQGRSWCDNKLWDKVFYGVGDLCPRERHE